MQNVYRLDWERMCTTTKEKCNCQKCIKLFLDCVSCLKRIAFGYETVNVHFVVGARQNLIGKFQGNGFWWYAWLVFDIWDKCFVEWQTAPVCARSVVLKIAIRFVSSCIGIGVHAHRRYCYAVYVCVCSSNTYRINILLSVSCCI